MIRMTDLFLFLDENINKINKIKLYHDDGNYLFSFYFYYRSILFDHFFHLDYITKEFKFDIDNNVNNANSGKSNDDNNNGK